MRWDPTTPGLLHLPSGRMVRGRGLGEPLPAETPEWGVYLLDQRPPDMPWSSRWVRWPDFGVPTDPEELHETLGDALQRAKSQRVELACWGGRGRTGTALACLAVLDGIPADESVAYVRQHYRFAAIETPEQEDFIRRFR